MSSLVKFVEEQFVEKKELPSFSSGDTITVYYEIREGDKTRTQFFKGVVLQRRGSGSTETFTIRKMSGSIGVERIFPINSPSIQKLRLIKEVKSEEHVFSISEILQVKKQKLKRKEIKIRLLTIVNIVGLQQVNFFFKNLSKKSTIILN